MKRPARIGLAILVFAGIALITRFPARALSQFYGLHAVLAAPFDAFFIVWFMQRYRDWSALALGILVLGVGLSYMAHTMGIGILVPLVITAILVFALSRAQSGNDKLSLIAAIAYGSLLYPCTLVGGILSHSAEAHLYWDNALLIIAGIALSVLGCCFSISQILFFDC